MPIYEYQCQSCGHEHEALQKLGADPLVICPACTKPELMKKISAAGFRLKGNGWYETDFKSGAKKNVAGEASVPCTPKVSSCPASGCKSD
ncbi:MAG: zinc ribbon domain-containing protein [Methylococcales bacterium]|nr:MAG: zinc ribbon domain-containing protein [Methylococcales bacterium]